MSASSTQTDCLIIGYNDTDFAGYVNWVREMGSDHGAYRDLNLGFVDHDGRPRHALDVLNLFSPLASPTLLANTDFLWPTITYLGTYLQRHGYTFDYVNQFQQEKESLRKKLEQGDVLTVAITTTLYVSALPVLEIVAFIREHSPTAKILIGGPYVANLSAYSEPEAMREQLRYIGADVYVINSEGEGALVRVLETLRNGGDLSNVENIAYRSGSEYVFTATSIESNSLEENMVDYPLFPHAHLGEFVSTRTAKSCPFACSFCGFPQRAGKYKYLSVELVEKELNAIRDIGGVTTITFLDDTFNVPKKRFQEILRMMIANNYGFKWNSFYRSDHGDEETIKLMAEAGCEGVFLGVESGSDETLKRMNKTARRKNYLESIPWLTQNNIISHASVIIGFPGETEESAAETVSLIEEAMPTYFRAQLWYADPLTPIWEQRETFGVKGSAFNWSHHTMDFRVASDIVDQMFLTMKNSVWLPQQGFEMWSLFYLERKGASRDGLRTYLRAFNAAIKERLLHPQRTEMSPEVLRVVRRAAQFSRADEAETRAEVDALDTRFREQAEASRRAEPIAMPTAEELEMLLD